MPLSVASENGKPSFGKGGMCDASHAVDESSANADAFAIENEYERSIIIIDSRALERECFAQSVRSHHSGAVGTFATVDELRLAKEQYRNISVILLTIGGLKITDVGVTNDIKQLRSDFATIPFIIVADNEDLAQILKALEMGARGYIPTTVGIGVAVGVIELALAGGVFVPASSILAMQGLINSNGSGARPLQGAFTARQREVVEALRRGKANKIIAYELNMCESTVKVHVRNIMKKLKASNRTEAAYKIDTLANDSQVSA